MEGVEPINDDLASFPPAFGMGLPAANPAAQLFPNGTPLCPIFVRASLTMTPGSEHGAPSMHPTSSLLLIDMSEDSTKIQSEIVQLQRVEEFMKQQREHRQREARAIAQNRNDLEQNLNDLERARTSLEEETRKSFNDEQELLSKASQFDPLSAKSRRDQLTKTAELLERAHGKEIRVACATFTTEDMRVLVACCLGVEELTSVTDLDSVRERVARSHRKHAPFRLLRLR
jgi:hypothetical protein